MKGGENMKGPKTKFGDVLYFQNIDTEAKAYYLGYLMADGNVSVYNGQYCLKLVCKIEDREVIDGFLSSIQSQNKTYIYTSNNKQYIRVSLSSVQAVKDLIKLGVTPRKSGFECIPNIQPNLIRHFIRGFFDGDGIVSIGKSGCRSGFVAPNKMCHDILTLIGIDATVTSCNTNVDKSYFLLGKKKTKILFDYLYTDCNIYLQRKRSKMETIIGNTEVNK